MEEKATEKRVTKKRFWWVVAYLDSLRPDWRDWLGRCGQPGAVSPYHDRDTWDKDKQIDGVVHKKGEPKKAHFHIIAKWKGPVARSTAMGWFANLADEGKHMARCKPIDFTIQKTFEYLWHKNHPEKAQYDPGEVTFFGGAGPEDFRDAPTAAETAAIKEEIRTIVRGNDLTNYSDLLDICASRGPEFEDWASSHTVYLCNWLAARRGKKIDELAAQQAAKDKAAHQDEPRP